MFNFLKKNKTKSIDRSIVIPLIGILHYLTWPEKSFWMGDVDTIGPNKIELSIDTCGGSDPTEEQIRLIRELPADYDYYMEMLYTYLEVAFEEFSLETMKQMYFLAAIELNKHNNDLLFSLEPSFDVRSVYNHFQRFQIANKTVIKYYED